MNVCSQEGCFKPLSAKGFCKGHYMKQWKAAQGIIRRIKPTALQRFADKIHITDECWLWTGGKDVAGYGVFSYGESNRAAHRFSYKTMVGEIPAGLHIDHLCAVRSCVNPDHLEAVTPGENIRRSWKNHPRTKKVVNTVIHVQRVEHVVRVESDGPQRATYTSRDIAKIIGVPPRTVQHRAQRLGIGQSVHATLTLYTDEDVEAIRNAPKPGDNRRRHDHND